MWCLFLGHSSTSTLNHFFPIERHLGPKSNVDGRLWSLGGWNTENTSLHLFSSLSQGKLKHDCLNSCYCFRQQFRTAFLKRESGNNLDPAMLFVYMSSGIMGLVRIFVHKLLLDLSNYHPSPLRLWQQKAYFFAISYNSKTSEKHNTKLMHNISRNVDSI